MHIEEKDPTQTAEVFSVHFPITELNKYIDVFVDERAKTFKKDGFRPGKVPVEVVRLHCLQDADRWAAEQLAQEGWRGLRKKYTDKHWSGVNSFDLDRSDPASIKVNITCEVWPTLNLEDKDIPSFDQMKVTVSDKTIQEWIPSMLNQLVVHDPQEATYAAQRNDLVCINLFFRHKGKELPDSRVTSSFVNLSPEHLLGLKDVPFFALFDQIVGKKQGDSFKYGFKATKNYHFGNRKLIGEHIECECRILRVEKLKDKPEAKDLAGRFGVDESGVANYIRESFQDYADLLEAMHNKRMVFDHLNSVFSFDVIEQRWKEEAARIMQAYEADANDKESEEIAKRRVRLGIIVEQLRAQCGKPSSQVVSKGIELYSLTHQLDPIVVMMWLQRVGSQPDQLNERSQADWQNIMSAINEWGVASHVVGRMKSKTRELEWKYCQKEWQEVLPAHFLNDDWALRYILTKKQRDEAKPARETVAE